MTTNGARPLPLPISLLDFVLRLQRCLAGLLGVAALSISICTRLMEEVFTSYRRGALDRGAKLRALPTETTTDKTKDRIKLWWEHPALAIQMQGYHEGSLFARQSMRFSKTSNEVHDFFDKNHDLHERKLLKFLMRTIGLLKLNRSRILNVQVKFLNKNVALF
jgi:hypothetical protein